MDDAELGEVATFLRALDRACPEQSTLAVESSQLAAVLEAARLLGQDSALPATAALARDGGPAVGSQAKMKTPVPHGVLARGWVKVTGLAVAALLLSGSAVYAGILPAPLQHAVASAAESLGVHLPDPARIAHPTTPVRRGPVSPAGVGPTEGPVGADAPGLGASSTAVPKRSRNGSATPGGGKAAGRGATARGSKPGTKSSHGAAAVKKPKPKPKAHDEASAGDGDHKAPKSSAQRGSDKGDESTKKGSDGR